jgi:asparagine synthase (glutamine-hydrolysing)
MLQTTPESVNEKQPLTNSDATLCLTMDGRIDNRLELRRMLESRGFPPRYDTDAELVLRAYECWGEDCPNRFLGDFAFAVWDARKRQLFCARDFVGVRPFYYHRSASLFAFGSEIRSVLALETVPRRLNESRVADFLVEELDREDEESTFYHRR